MYHLTRLTCCFLFCFVLGALVPFCAGVEDAARGTQAPSYLQLILSSVTAYAGNPNPVGCSIKIER